MTTAALKDFQLLAAKQSEQGQPSEEHTTSTTAGDCLIRNHITWYTADIITHSLWQCYL